MNGCERVHAPPATLVRSTVVAVVAVGLTCSAGFASAPNAPSASSARAATPVVKTAHNAKLHETILVNRRGRTLYSLSVEKHGRFICTDQACLSLWTPLVIARGARPKHVVRSLGTVRRPNGRTQVTYRGRPLYTFNEDGRRGDVKDEGFVDVGTWHAAVVHR